MNKSGLYSTACSAHTCGAGISQTRVVSLFTESFELLEVKGENTSALMKGNWLPGGR